MLSLTSEVLPYPEAVRERRFFFGNSPTLVLIPTHLVIRPTVRFAAMALPRSSAAVLRTARPPQLAMYARQTLSV